MTLRGEEVRRVSLSWSREGKTQKMGKLQRFCLHLRFHKLSLLEQLIFFPASLPWFKLTLLHCTSWSLNHFFFSYFATFVRNQVVQWGLEVHCEVSAVKLQDSREWPLSSALWCCCLEQWCLLWPPAELPVVWLSRRKTTFWTSLCYVPYSVFLFVFYVINCYYCFSWLTFSFFTHLHEWRFMETFLICSLIFTMSVPFSSPV